MKWRTFLFKKKYSAKIVSTPQFKSNKLSFLVKLDGLSKSILFTAEEIIYTHPEKFPCEDIRTAVLEYQKTKGKRYKVKAIIDKHAAIYDRLSGDVTYVDLTTEIIAKKFDLNQFDALDSYRLGMYAERLKNLQNRTLCDNIKYQCKPELKVIDGKRTI